MNMVEHATGANQPGIFFFIMPPMIPKRSSCQSTPIHGSRPAVLQTKWTRRLIRFPAMYYVGPSGLAIIFATKTTT